MKRIIKVAVNGDAMFFDNALSDKEYDVLQSFADTFASNTSLDLEDLANLQACFIDAVKRCLKISLVPIKISHVIRIRTR
jgi:hypothetical protein